MRKKLLLIIAVRGYAFSAPAKSGVGRENPDMLEATPDAASVFFIVAISAHLYSAANGRPVSMVALVGQLSGWPVSSNAGILTPASVTAPFERENSGGDPLESLEEAIAMANSAHLLSPHTSTTEVRHV